MLEIVSTRRRRSAALAGTTLLPPSPTRSGTSTKVPNKILRVGIPAIRSRLRSNIIPAHLISGSWIIFKQEIRAWLASTSNQPPAAPEPIVDILASYGEEMTYRDLMNLFGKTKQTIYIWLSEGCVPASHVAGRWLIFKFQVEELLAETSNQNIGKK